LKSICWCSILAVGSLYASGHGPVFGLATPTNPAGGWSLDLSEMFRVSPDGFGAMMRAEIGYGVTENLKLTISGPAVFAAEPLPPARVSAFMPMGGDFEALAIWRFHRQDLEVGKRFESTAIAGVIEPGPQRAAGPGPGFYTAAVTGLASRSNYVWAGGGYQRYRNGTGMVTYSAVYGYRPQSWRTDYPRWDFRLFGEMTGELLEVRPATTHQVFVGPSVLGVYKNYAISAGFQLPAHRESRERFRLALNFAYFF
jgi:hypothetical protein